MLTLWLAEEVPRCVEPTAFVVAAAAAAPAFETVVEGEDDVVDADDGATESEGAVENEGALEGEDGTAAGASTACVRVALGV